MSIEDDFADLLVENESDHEDQEFNLRPSKKKSSVHSFVFKVRILESFFFAFSPSFPFEIF